MFGSDFFGNFGIPNFPFQGSDPQGGLLGPNVSQNAAPENMAVGAVTNPVGASPLGGGALAPGAGAPQTPASPQNPQASPLAKQGP